MSTWMRQEPAAQTLPPSPLPGRQYLTDEVASRIEEMLANIASRSGFGNIVLTMVHGKIKEAEDRATHRF